MKKLLMPLTFFVVFLFGCIPSQSQQPTISTMPSQLAVPPSTPTAIFTPTPTPTITATVANTPTPTATPTVVLPLSEGQKLPKIVTINQENIRDLKEIAILGHGTLRQILMSLDGKELLVLTHSGLFRYDPTTLKLIRFQEMNLLKFNMDIYGSFFSRISPDEKVVVVNGYYKDEKNRGKMIFVSPGNLQPIFTVDGISAGFSPDGTLVAIGGTESVSIMNLADQKKKAVIQADYVDDIVFSPDSTLLSAYASVHNLTQIFRVDDRKVMNQFIGVHGLAFTGNNSIFAGYNSEGYLQLFDLKTSKLMFTVKDARFPKSLVFLPDSRNFVVGYADNLLELRSSSDGNLVTKSPGLPINRGTVSISPNNKQVSANWANFWDINSLSLQYVNKESFGQGVYSTDGNYYVTIDRNGQNITLRNSKDGSVYSKNGTFPGSTGLAFMHSDGRTVSLSNSYGIMYWDLMRGENVNAEQVVNIANQAMTLNGDRTAAGYYMSNRTPPTGIILYGRGLKEQYTIPMVERTHGLAFSNNGNTLAVCAEDSKVFLINLNTRAKQGPYPCQCRQMGQQPAHLFFSLDDKMVSCSDRFLRVSNGEIAYKFPTDLGGRIDDAGLSSNGSLFATLSWDGIIRLWGILQ